MRRPLTAACLALLALTAGCAKPHPVRTEAEAIAVAREALKEIEGAKAPLTVHRQGAKWIVAAPRKHVGANWGQYSVDIDSRTGRATVSSFQYVVINEDL